MLCGILLAAVLAACSPADRAIVTEVYYDALGDDTGYEFVELFNPSAQPVALNGVRLEAGDGAAAGRWTLKWTGGALDTIAAGARFVIGGALVSPPPNAVVSLSLQNGPDAVRLVWPDGPSEVVGYGVLALAEYFCGAPAADAASGFSLARVPDAADLGSNAADFREAAPSPGRANQSQRDLAIVAGSVRLDAERPPPGVALTASALLANAGADTIAVGDLALAAEVEELEFGVLVSRRAVVPERLRHRAARPLSGPVAPLAPERVRHRAAPSANDPPVLGPLVIAPGDTLAFDVTLDPLAAGKYRLWITATVAGDENPANDRDSLRFRVGEGPIAITEIQFHPGDGEGEWVEVRNRSGASLDLAAFTLSDRGTSRGVPRDGFGMLEPDSFAVFAQDRAALLAAWPGLNAARVWAVSPWPALNNSDDETGVADLVMLRESDGLVAERIAYRAGGIPSGVPIELRDGEWLAALDPRGTPLAPSRALAPAARAFDLAPPRVAAAGGTVTLTWALPWPRAYVRADLYDLDGRRVGELLPERSAAGRGTRDLAFAASPPGVYFVALEARAATGGERLVEARPLRVVGNSR